MSRQQFAKRQALIAAGKCPRCAKPIDPWPLKRADVCHTIGSVVCPRHWPDILAAEARLRVS